MEPGHEDREYDPIRPWRARAAVPQWSPVMKTGNTGANDPREVMDFLPQWSPVMKTGNTGVSLWESQTTDVPQWSPVMKTGNTRAAGAHAGPRRRASMEPGHEDREYRPREKGHRKWPPASMEPGHEDREYDLSGLYTADEMTASMEPGHEDREYMRMNGLMDITALPQWSPVMKTGNT